MHALPTSKALVAANSAPILSLSLFLLVNTVTFTGVFQVMSEAIITFTGLFRCLAAPVRLNARTAAGQTRFPGED